MSPIPETAAWKVDSLVQSWAGLYAYAYPPTALIRSCLNKIRLDKAEVILIAPYWPNQEWFPDLVVNIVLKLIYFNIRNAVHLLNLATISIPESVFTIFSMTLPSKNMAMRSCDFDVIF